MVEIIPPGSPQELPRSAKELAVLIDDEHRRQDAHLAAVRALVGDSKSLRIANVDAAPSRGVLSNLRRRLSQRRASRSTEDELRARIETALKESRRASLLVDRFAALREELFADVSRINAIIAAAGAVESAAAHDVVASSVANAVAGADGESAHSDNARLSLVRDEQRHELAQRTCERLAVVVVSARGLIAVIDTLSADVAAFARAAERELDVLSARARAISVAEDAAAVVVELERSLLSLSSSLDDVTVFASAVHERVAHNDDARGLASALDALVQGALAKRAATKARDEANQT